MRKRSSKGGGAQRSIQVHLMVNEEEAAMIRAAARKRNQTVSLTIIEAVKLLEGSLYVEEEEHDSPQALRAMPSLNAARHSISYSSPVSRTLSWRQKLISHAVYIRPGCFRPDSNSFGPLREGTADASLG